MIDKNFIICDTCPSWLFEFGDVKPNADRIERLRRAIVICETCLAKFAKAELIDQMRFAELPTK